jgi:hypothetical protein
VPLMFLEVPDIFLLVCSQTGSALPIKRQDLFSIGGDTVGPPPDEHVAERIGEILKFLATHGLSPPNVRGHRADEVKDATGSAASEAPSGPRC